MCDTLALATVFLAGIILGKGEATFTLKLLFAWLYNYALYTGVAANSLALIAVKEAACPGEELVYNCTVSSNTAVFELRWREAMTTTPLVQYVYDAPQTLTDKTLGDFTTTAGIIPPDYTLTSTATLRGAQFSHNNFKLECLTFQQISISNNKTILIRGIIASLKLQLVTYFL